MSTVQEPAAPELLYEVDGRGIATITLNRPERLNAFTLDMIAVWGAALDEAQRDPAVRVVVLRAAGRAFCSGVDIKELDSLGTTAEARKGFLTDHIHAVPLAVDRLDKPLIASIQGAAVGAGMDMALMCDLRVASRSAKFCEGYIKVGLVPGDGGCHFLPRLVGRAKALELLWTADMIDAEEAMRIGLVNKLVDDDELESATDELAAKIARQPPLSARMIKRAVTQGERLDMRTALDLISSHMAVVQSTADSEALLGAARARFDTSQKEANHQ